MPDDLLQWAEQQMHGHWGITLGSGASIALATTGVLLLLTVGVLVGALI